MDFLSHEHLANRTNANCMYQNFIVCKFISCAWRSVRASIETQSKWAKQALAEARSSGAGSRQPETKLMMKFVKEGSDGNKKLNFDDPYFQDFIERYEELGSPLLKRNCAYPSQFLTRVRMSWRLCDRCSYSALSVSCAKQIKVQTGIAWSRNCLCGHKFVQTYVTFWRCW